MSQPTYVARNSLCLPLLQGSKLFLLARRPCILKRKASDFDVGQERVEAFHFYDTVLMLDLLDGVLIGMTSELSSY